MGVSDELRLIRCRACNFDGRSFFQRCDDIRVDIYIGPTRIRSTGKAANGVSNHRQKRITAAVISVRCRRQLPRRMISHYSDCGASAAAVCCYCRQPFLSNSVLKPFGGRVASCSWLKRTRRAGAATATSVRSFPGALGMALADPAAVSHLGKSTFRAVGNEISLG
jgi:hypothetical protein